MLSKKFWTRYIWPVTIATALSELITYIIESEDYLKQPQKIIFALVLGVLAGWAFELVREQNRLLEKANKDLEIVSRYARYHSEVLNIMLSSPRYGEVLASLLIEALRSGHIFPTITRRSLSKH